MARKWLGTRLLLVALLGASLLVASHATSATTTVSATATITGSGTSYRLTVRNTGDEPILCFGLLLDGVQPVAASGPTGVLTRVGTFQGRGLVHMQGTPSVPAVPAGGTATADFRTNVAIPPSAGGEIRYSSTCAAGSDVTGRATGPTPPPSPPPPPPKRKCLCKSLEVKSVDLAPFPGFVDMSVRVSWRLSCAPKGGGKCEGRIRLVAPRKKFAVTVAQKDGVFCEGTCSKASEGRRDFDLNLGGKRDSIPLKGETFRLKLRKFCKRGLVYVPVGTQTATIAFGEDGRLDKVQSDLNANGEPDGDE